MHCSPVCLFVSVVAIALAGGVRAQEPAKPSAPAAASPARPAAQQPANERPRPADARELFATFAKLPGLEATYEEEKHLALLALPLKSSGRMLFLPPGYLARAVEAPEKSLLVITPTEVRIDGRDGREVVDLKRSDRVRTFVTALVQVFAGNEAQLQKAFAVEYAHDPKSKQGWTLALVPKTKELEPMLKRLTMHGEGVAVVSIVVEDPTGDRTVTKITSADANRTFDAAEQKKWFGIEPR